MGLHGGVTLNLPSLERSNLHAFILPDASLGQTASSILSQGLAPGANPGHCSCILPTGVQAPFLPLGSAPWPGPPIL